MQNQPTHQPTVAVITSTIGRPKLEQAILSVQQQTYPCRHYVFVDGEQFHQPAAEILKKYPNVVVTYLPMNTGANGWTNSSINAIAPFLIKEDILCYLDDDNWYEPNHVEAGVKALNESNADYAYALRNFFDDQRFICVDTYESIGEYQRGWESPISFEIRNGNKTCSLALSLHSEHHIDTNCYFFRHAIAKSLSQAWHTGLGNDRHLYATLHEQGFRGICTNVISVNYLVDVKKYMGWLYQKCQESKQIQASPKEAHDICINLLKALSEESMAGWGGRLIWEEKKP